MKVLTAFAAISACRFGDTRQAALRHEDSSARILLRGAAESACVRAMTNAPSALPHDVDALHALILAERAAHAAVIAERDQLATHNEKLEHIVAEMRRAMYGRRSERIDDNQLALALEALETAHAKVQAEAEKANPALKSERTRQRRKSRTESLDHLPHEEVVIEPESKVCPCCNGALHKIGEDVSKRLDKMPAKLTVVVTRRPKLACRDCEKTGADEVAGIIQAPAPARLIEGGLPTERLVADIVVSKFADHLPLYRQSQILARSGVHIERSTLAHWVGAAAAELQPLHDWLVEHAEEVTKTVLRRDALPRARSRTRRDQDRLHVGARARRPAMGRHRSAGGRLHLRARPRRRARGEAARRLQRRPAGRRLCRLRPARPANAGWRAGDARLLLEPSAAQVLRALRGPQPADRDARRSRASNCSTTSRPRSAACRLRCDERCARRRPGPSSRR